MSSPLYLHEENIIVSSSTGAGATNVSADGSSFYVTFADPIKIPAHAKNVQLSLHSSTIWWTVPNVTTNINDSMYIEYFNGTSTGTYNITVPQGLYDLEGLNSAVQVQLENAGAPTSPDTLIELQSDEATQKVLIRRNYANTSIDFTQSDTFRDIVGFNSQVLAVTGASNLTTIADNVASFNTIEKFLFHSDLVARGIRIGSSYNQTIGEVLIDVSPGSQIVSKDYNPPKSSASELVGAIRNRARFWITDQDNQNVNTNSEIFTGRIVLSYLA